MLNHRTLLPQNANQAQGQVSNLHRNPLAVPIKKKQGPPPAGRVTLETQQLEDIVSENDNVQCKFCHNGLVIAFDHVGITSTPALWCQGGCPKAVKPPPTGASLHDEKVSRPRLTQSSVNILCALSFLTVGDGGLEAQRLTGFLDPPRNTSIEKCAFTQTEKELAPTIEEITVELLFNNLCAEVKATHKINSTFDFDG